MSAFICFRSGLALRPSTMTACLKGTIASHFHTTSPAFKKKDDSANPPFATGRRKIEIPEHKPTPKPRRGKKIGIPYVHLLTDSDRTLPPHMQTGSLRSLDEIIESVDPNEFAVELVSEDPPVVKLVNLEKARLETLMARQKSKKGAGQRDLHKEVQLTWSMAEADETHKLLKARQELEKGNRVDLVYSPKKGTKPPPKLEIQFKIKEIMQKFEDVAKEAKPATFDYRMGVLHLQPKHKVSMKLDPEQLKDVVPKSVIEHQKAVEKEQRRRAAAEQARQNAAPQESSYNTLWGA
ncbi:hypothetical protein BKA70DRAFT_1316531 [Coprinopsis sp. MPI-PUGE-AT-0042]|nr:hypothetical protein BKA70DRAFT_1316531 [Coprinopsis sp. MPI-PUGE-AT-0042]